MNAIYRCARTKCCIWFCEGEKAYKVGIVLFCIFFFLGSTSFGIGLYASSIQSNYQSNVKPDSNCTAYCGNNRAFPSNNTFNSCCSSYQGQECSTKQECYDGYISQLETIEYCMLAGWFVGLTYVMVFTYYYVIKSRKEKQRRMLLERLIAAAVAPRPEPEPIPPEQLDHIIDNLLRMRENGGPAIDRLRPSMVHESHEDTCVICFEGFNEEERAIRLECEHIFHGSCIRQWMRNHNTCPLCMRRQ